MTAVQIAKLEAAARKGLSHQDPLARELALVILALTEEVTSLRRQVSDAGWALDAARHQYEIDHAADWR